MKTFKGFMRRFDSLIRESKETQIDVVPIRLRKKKFFIPNGYIILDGYAIARKSDGKIWADKQGIPRVWKNKSVVIDMTKEGYLISDNNNSALFVNV